MSARAKTYFSSTVQDYPAYLNNTGTEKSWKRPRTWSRRCWLLAAAVVVILLIIVIVVPIEVVKANRYPNYYPLKYSLKDTYSGESFFDQFDYFYGYDPAQGFVHYADESASKALNLTYASESSAILRVDMRDNIDTTTGRISARVQSKNTYDNGLFIFDVKHSPYGCATWPALWLTNQDSWPLDGEIDVMEGVNTNNIGNQVTLHTTTGCSMSDVKRKQTGQSTNGNCYNGTDDNAGCGVRGPKNTIGAEFNANGGGILALEWRNAGIRSWFFDRSSIPSDLAEGNMTSPDPSTWPEPMADFPSTDCDISSHFSNQSIIANIDFCGQWAGVPKIFNGQDQCPGTCVDYVSQQNSSAFTEAYWEFGSWWVFQAAQ